MTRPRFRFSRAIYRFLLRGYPASFRDRFGPSMESDFVEMLEERPRVLCWARALGDLITSIPRERARRRAPRRDSTVRSMADEIRVAARSLRDAPGFTAVAVATLSLGIGANSAVLTVVDSILLRPLPYENPEELVMIWESHEERGIDRTPRPEAWHRGAAPSARPAGAQ